MIAVALLLFAGISLITGGAYALGRLNQRRRQRRPRALSDREVMDALAPFGADISVWPSRAPRNGSTYDPVE